jgi:hypothetical protein
MTLNFPVWSDLSIQVAQGPSTRNAWDYELAKCERFLTYWSGEVFNEKIPAETTTGEDQPLMFPVGMNIVKMLTVAQADSVYGEWDTRPVEFVIKPEVEAGSTEKAGASLANSIVDASTSNFFWELALDREVFGGAAFKISPTNMPGTHIRWSRLTRDQFYPIVDPTDPDNLLEVYIVTSMSQEQAKAKFGYDGTKDNIQMIEHWTPIAYTTTIDGRDMSQFSGFNPWGIIPFVYCPRFRFIDWYGESLTDDIIPSQDELNMRVADVGEAINYNSHPVRWGVNLPRGFNAENYPLDANSMWDLGRTVGSNPPPEVGILESTAAVQPGTQEYIKFVYDWSRTSVFAPPIAFGEDNGGGQRSGSTLEIRMWPLIKSIRRSRTYLQTAFKRALYISGTILQQKQYSDVKVGAINSILKADIVPNFQEIMPRDQAAIVDEVVKLLSTNPPSISLETSQTILGRGSAETTRIESMLKNVVLWNKPIKPPDGGNIDKGSLSDGRTLPVSGRKSADGSAPDS